MRDQADKITATPEDVHLPIDMAVKYHMTMNFFYHPIYIVQFPRCREAIEEIVRYIEYKKVSILHLGADQLCRWWNARSASDVRMDLGTGGSASAQEQDPASDIRLTAHCTYESGMIVKIALPESGIARVTCNDQESAFRVKWEFGRNWLYIVVPQGQHQIVIHKLSKREEL